MELLHFSLIIFVEFAQRKKIKNNIFPNRGTSIVSCLWNTKQKNHEKSSKDLRINHHYAD
jgi:hypothetical protein